MITELFYNVISGMGVALFLGALIALIISGAYSLSLSIVNRLCELYGRDTDKLTGFYKNTFKL